MLRLAGVALGVGLADSLNPSTVGPALYLAATRNGVLRVMLFAIGVFSVNLAGGIALTLGPGRLLRGLVPHPQGTARHVMELVAGVVLLAVAVALWVGRRSLARRELARGGGGRGSALLLGGLIAAVELPTAVPYFAVVGAIVASNVSVLQSIVLLALYCVAFVAPLLAIAAALLVAGDRARPGLQKAAAALQRRWPVVLASVLLLVGGGLTVLGGTGLLKQ